MKRVLIENVFFFLLYKAKFYISSSFKKKISSTVAFKLQDPNIASWKHQYNCTDRSEPVQYPELLQAWEGTIWSVPRTCCESLQPNTQWDGPCPVPCPCEELPVGRWQQLGSWSLTYLSNTSWEEQDKWRTGEERNHSETTEKSEITGWVVVER